MKKLQGCIAAMRLRTLPLSLAGVILGSLLAIADYRVHWTVIFFLFLTACWLHILVNLANELGDFQSGTDSSERVGPCYALTQGLLTVKDFKLLITFCICCACISGVAMIWFSFKNLFCIEALMLALFGVSAIIAALRYTLGRNPYGYRGLGDISVFIYFGVATVAVAYFICAHTISWLILLPTTAVGLFSVGVLNVNNIRDIETDRATRKTIPIRIGEKAAKVYHTALISVGYACMVVFCVFRIWDPWHYLFLLSAPLFIIHVVNVWKYSGKALDPHLPMLVMSTLVFCILGGLGFVIYLF